MHRTYNFSAGPAVLPEEVLRKAQKELLDYKGSGMSVMELSHRGELFQEIIGEAESLLRGLLEVPNEYEILFLQGGASLQFSMLPMNLRKNSRAAYIETGSWSKKALKEAEKLGFEADVLASSTDQNHTYIPKIPAEITGYDFLHLTSNNTIEGTQFQDYPSIGEVPLAVDMSSDILSRPLDISQFGLIYAGAQKNIGPAGLTVIIIRKDLIGLNENLPSTLDYKIHADSGSLYNTPPTYSIYMAKLVFEWIKNLGGLKEMHKLNREKAQVLYDYLDESELFSSPVQKEFRSLMNVPFVTGDRKLDSLFIEEAEKRDFQNLKGHRSVGGMRASIYNSFPKEGVLKLVDFMKEFEKERGRTYVPH